MFKKIATLVILLFSIALFAKISYKPNTAKYKEDMIRVKVIAPTDNFSFENLERYVLELPLDVFSGAPAKYAKSKNLLQYLGQVAANEGEKISVSVKQGNWQNKKGTTNGGIRIWNFTAQGSNKTKIKVAFGMQWNNLTQKQPTAFIDSKYSKIEIEESKMPEVAGKKTLSDEEYYKLLGVNTARFNHYGE